MKLSTYNIRHGGLKICQSPVLKISFRESKVLFVLFVFVLVSMGIPDWETDAVWGLCCLV